MYRSSSSLLFETIQVRDGVPKRLEMHAARMNASRHQLLGCDDTLELTGMIEAPLAMRQGLVKCRLTYGKRIDQIQYEPYVPRQHGGFAIATLVDLDYSHKFTERSAFARIDGLAQGRLVMITRQGYITDSTYSNLALFDGEQWVTPSTYLLNGIMRQSLLQQGMLVEREVRVDDLSRYHHARPINAMLEFHESPIVSLESIVQI